MGKRGVLGFIFGKDFSRYLICFNMFGFTVAWKAAGCPTLKFHVGREFVLHIFGKFGLSKQFGYKFWGRDARWVCGTADWLNFIISKGRRIL